MIDKKRDRELFHLRVVLLVNVLVGQHGAATQHGQLTAASRVLVQGQHRSVLWEGHAAGGEDGDGGPGHVQGRPVAVQERDCLRQRAVSLCMYVSIYQAGKPKGRRVNN